MKKEANAVSRWADFSGEKLTAIGEVELAIIKVHVVFEDLLKFVLANRLGVPDGEFIEERIPFKILLKISLAGTSSSHLVGALRALTRARNGISHQVEAEDVSKNLRTFALEIGHAVNSPLSWPENPADQVKVLQQCLDEAVVELVSLT